MQYEHSENTLKEVLEEYGLACYRIEPGDKENGISMPYYICTSQIRGSQKRIIRDHIATCDAGFRIGRLEFWIRQASARPILEKVSRTYQKRTGKTPRIYPSPRKRQAGELSTCSQEYQSGELSISTKEGNLSLKHS